MKSVRKRKRQMKKFLKKLNCGRVGVNKKKRRDTKKGEKKSRPEKMFLS